MKPVENGFTAMGLGGARWRPAHASMVTAPLAVFTTFAVVPELTGADGFAVRLLAVGSCLAAVAVSPRAVAGVGAYTIALGAALLWSSQVSTTPAHKAGHGLVLAAISVLAVVIARRRRNLEHAARQTITTWNPGAERMYGYPADEAIGHNVAMTRVMNARLVERDRVELLSAFLTVQTLVAARASFAPISGSLG